MQPLPRRLHLALMCLLLLLNLPARAGDDIPAHIGAQLAQGLQPASRWPQLGDLRPALEQAYLARQYQPLWLAGGAPSPRAHRALELMEDAQADALAAADYDTRWLRGQFEALARQPGDALRQAQLDIGLSLAFARYLRDLHSGRVDPRALGLRLDVSLKRNGITARLQQALREQDPEQAAQAMRPAIALYGQLRALLLDYRLLARQHPQRPPLPPLPGRKLEPGQHWAGSGALAQWLELLGDLPAGARAPEHDLYGGELAQALRRFQARHGLAADGVIGAQTYAALSTPLPRRVHQIELAMERLRWIDDALRSGRYIAVNIPEYTLWAYEAGAEAPVLKLRMPVVVGKALKTETPVFLQQMRTLVFSPYWNVPRSIAVKELIPKLRREPGYLVEENMELVGAGGYRYSGIVGETELRGIAAGHYRIRQLPGEKNALGGVKFVFPNDDSIYMHSTPQQSLFSRGRRDFSHGCIRVAEPVQLALFALRGNPEWDEARVREAMRSEREQHIALKWKVPVLILYSTANVDEQGRGVFLNDIYQHDRKLEEALAGRRP